MKVLLDTCVWGGAKQILKAAGHDVIWSGDWPTDPGDEEVLTQAHQEGRVLVTLDKDFGELAVVYGQPHSGILRLVNLAARQQGPICLRILESQAMSCKPEPLSLPMGRDSASARQTDKPGCRNNSRRTAERQVHPGRFQARKDLLAWLFKNLIKEFILIECILPLTMPFNRLDPLGSSQT